jgi:hypothetical protein
VQICTTVDGVRFLHPTTQPLRLFTIRYLLAVRGLPGGLDRARVPVALEARRIGGTSGVFGIRNGTNGTWIGFNVAQGVCVASSDLGAVDDELAGLNSAASATDAADPAQGGVAPGLIVSATATIELALGINEITIENFGAGGPGSDDGDIAQVFMIAFGPSEEDLEGGLCQKTEDVEISCTDGLDNDCDGFIDGEDTDCDVGGTRFKRGDVNVDASLNIADAIFTLSYLFGGGAEPACGDAADANDDGSVNIADAVAILSHLFAGSGPLPDPFGSCGLDAEGDTLDCGSFPPCLP